MKRFFRARVLVWPLLLVTLFIGGITAAFATGGLNVLALSSIFGGDTTKESSEVIKFIVPEQQVVLASAQIEGLERQTTGGKIFGIQVPASDRTTYIAYKFDAKLGIEGAEFDIDPVTGKENAYKVSIPAFIFIAHGNPSFDDPIESNAVLGWLAEEANQTKMTNSILSDRNTAKYVENSKQVLVDQAKAFYASIIRSVSPDAEIEFVFDGEPTIDKGNDDSKETDD